MQKTNPDVVVKVYQPYCTCAEIDGAC